MQKKICLRFTLICLNSVKCQKSVTPNATALASPPPAGCRLGLHYAGKTEPIFSANMWDVCVYIHTYSYIYISYNTFYSQIDSSVEIGHCVFWFKLENVLHH